MATSEVLRVTVEVVNLKIGTSLGARGAPEDPRSGSSGTSHPKQSQAQKWVEAEKETEKQLFWIQDPGRHM